MLILASLEVLFENHILDLRLDPRGFLSKVHELFSDLWLDLNCLHLDLFDLGGPHLLERVDLTFVKDDAISDATLHEQDSLHSGSHGLDQPLLRVELHQKWKDQVLGTKLEIFLRHLGIGGQHVLDEASVPLFESLASPAEFPPLNSNAISKEKDHHASRTILLLLPSEVVNEPFKP